jgi:phage repressor protein C with HTH and peptisase S24 domain
MSIDEILAAGLPEEYFMIPALESRVGAGPEGTILYDEVAEQYPFKRSWLTHLVGRGQDHLDALLLVRVRGASMAPTINAGELALVDTYESERIDIQDGRIYLVVLPDGTITMKRLVLKRRDDTLTLVCLSDNTQDFRPFDFDIEPARQIKHYVLGRVRWAGKEFE